MMSSLPDYVVADPSGNITVLVTQLVPPDKQAETAALLFAAEPQCEQVGYVSNAVPGRSISIRMSGGEFCGNAALSAAAYALMLGGEAAGDIRVDFCGVDAPMYASVERVEQSFFKASVSMPLPESVKDTALQLGEKTCILPVVAFPGISHVVMNGSVEKQLAEASVRQWCRKLDVPALGLIMLEPEENRLTPLVYVSAVDTLYWEKSCASGTCAAARVLFLKEGKNECSFKQPGGILSAKTDGGSLYLFGSVGFKSK